MPHFLKTLNVLYFIVTMILFDFYVINASCLHFSILIFGTFCKFSLHRTVSFGEHA